MKTMRHDSILWLVGIFLLIGHLTASAGPQIQGVNRLPSSLPTIEQGARDLPVIARADVVIAGGGLAGVTAALRAAEEGRSVILIEERNCLAHEATVSWDCAPGKAQPSAEHPITASLLDALKAKETSAEGGPNPLRFKSVAHNRVAAQPRIRVLFFSLPSGVVLEGNRVCGVVIVNHAGRQVVLARAVVDATEQTQIAAAAGARFDGERHSEQVVQRFIETKPKPEPEAVRSAMARDALGDCAATVGPRYIELSWKMHATGDAASDWSRAQTITLSRCFALREAMTRNGTSFKKFEVSPEIIIESDRQVHCRAADGEGAHLPEGVAGLVIAAPGPERPRGTALLCAGETAGKIAAGVAQKAAGFLDVTETATATATGTGAAQVKELLSGPETGVRYSRLKQASQRLPVTARCDVIVVGGGTSGAFAAIAAARKNAKVVLVEIRPNLGGTSSNRVNGYYWGVPWKSALSAEVDEGIDAQPNPGDGGLEKVRFSGEEKKRALQELALKAGVEILYRSFGAGVVVEGNRVTGVIVENASGRHVILAKTVVDATGHGDLATAAGAEFEKGRPKDGFLHEAEHGPLRDSTDAEDMSKYYLRLPSYALSLNIRESRRIRGDYTLTFDDVIHNRRFPDTVARWRSNYDSHFPHSANEEDRAQDWIAILGLFRKPILGDIPYRCLLPKGLGNILVAGKAYSATHDALIGARMQRDLQHLGEAAGVAAAMASHAEILPRSVSVADLRAELVRLGVLRSEDVTEAPAASPADLSALAARLGTKKSLDAMVELYLAGERAVPALKPLLDSADAAKHTEAALVLGMLHQRDAIPSLLDVLARRDARMFTFSLPRASSRPSVPAYQAAVILLGRFQAKEAVGPITALLRNPQQCPPGLASFAIVALGRIGDPSAIAAVKPYLTVSKSADLQRENTAFEQHWGVRTNAARALANLGDKSGVPMLISLLDSDQSLLRNHAQQLLEEISGRSFGKDREAWSRWWKQSQTGNKAGK
ncbi:MAG: FAD-dependent oxidoreductase [Verrucomicrobia bacterium]|nr:FAD-dependent oxidoreductase [Verrucomicrobiota bacterium]